MIQKKYIDQLSQLVRSLFPDNKVFIFGSSLRESQFNDVDIAIEGKVDSDDFFALEQSLYNSCFPYKTDIVVFDEADDSFRSYVLDNEVKQWI